MPQLEHPEYSQNPGYASQLRYSLISERDMHIHQAPTLYFITGRETQTRSEGTLAYFGQGPGPEG